MACAGDADYHLIPVLDVWENIELPLLLDGRIVEIGTLRSLGGQTAFRIRIPASGSGIPRN
jgi:hypothetical protein